MLLSRMFYFVESGRIQEPIYSPEQAPLGTSNKDFLQEYVASILHNAFNNLQEYVFVESALYLSNEGNANANQITGCK